MKERKGGWQLFNIDSLVSQASAETPLADFIDLAVASLAFKNFDFVAKRLPLLVECSTRDPSVWLQLVDRASERYWIREADEGLAVYEATAHCGCIRTYRLNIDHEHRHQRWNRAWIEMPTEKSVYEHLDSPGARAVFEAWHRWRSSTNQHATDFAEGRLRNADVGQALIFSSGEGCIVCGAPSTAHASTTAALGPGGATFVQLPVCAQHLESARAEPTVLTFLAKTFSLSIGLPELVRHSSIPDELIPAIHQYIASELGGYAGMRDRRERGWHLSVEFPTGWHWLLRVNTLTDYAYMLFKPDDKKKAVYRADSAPDHPELPFFPDHEHSRPDRMRDVRSPSFLYGLPLFDLKRLREVGMQFGVLENFQAP